MYGPPGFLDRVEGRLRGYTWNLVEGYSLTLDVHEVHPDRVVTARFACPEGFLRLDDPAPHPFDGVILDEPQFSSTQDGRRLERALPLWVLRREVVRANPGQKLAYVTDAVNSPENAQKIVKLAWGADVFSCEPVGIPSKPVETRGVEQRVTC